jgi:hypothetical protein
MGKTVLGAAKTVGQGILNAFPKLKPIVDTVVGAFKDIPGTLGAATDFVKDAWAKLGKISDKLKEQKEKEAKAGEEAEKAGIEEQKKLTKTSLRDRVAKKIQSLKDEGKPVPESLQKKYDDLQKEVGQERNLKEQEGIDKQKEEAIRNREMRKAKSVTPKPILEGAKKLGEFVGKGGGLGTLLGEGISGLMPTGAEMEAAGIKKQKEKTAESLRRRKEAAVAAKPAPSVPTFLDPNAPPFPTPPRPLPDNMNDWGPKDWDEADKSIFGPMAGLMGVPINEAQDKERVRRSDENPYGHPLGNVPGPWRTVEDSTEASLNAAATEPEVKLPEGVSNALQNLGGLVGTGTNRAAGGIAGAVGNLFGGGAGGGLPGLGGGGGAPTAPKGPLPLEEYLHNMQDPLRYSLYQMEENKKKYKSQGGRLADPVGPLSPERLDYLEGIEKTAPRFAGQEDKMSGQETIQRATGTTKGLQESMERMKANRDKFQAELDKAEEKGLSKESKVYKNKENRVKRLDENIGIIQGVLDQRAGKDQSFKPNIPGMNLPQYPGGANFPARPPEDPEAKQKAQQMIKTMGFENSFTGGKRKVKLTDTPLAAAQLIIDFLKNNCLMTKPCETTTVDTSLLPADKADKKPLPGPPKNLPPGAILGPDDKPQYDQGDGTYGPKKPLPGYRDDGGIEGPDGKLQYPQGDGTYGPNKPPEKLYPGSVPRPGKPAPTLRPGEGPKMGPGAFNPDYEEPKLPAKPAPTLRPGEGPKMGPGAFNPDYEEPGTAAQEARKKIDDEYVKYGTQGGKPVMVDLYNAPNQNPGARVEGPGGAFQYQQPDGTYGDPTLSSVDQSSSPRTNAIIDEAQKTIDETKRMLMEQYGLSEDEYNEQMKQAGNELQSGGSLRQPTNPEYGSAIGSRNYRGVPGTRDFLFGGPSDPSGPSPIGGGPAYKPTTSSPGDVIQKLGTHSLKDNKLMPSIPDFGGLFASNPLYASAGKRDMHDPRLKTSPADLLDKVPTQPRSGRIDAANAERQAPGGNVFEGVKASIDKLVAAGPLVNDETIKMFSSSNESLANSIPSFQASVDKLSQVLATNITLSIVSPDKAIPVNVHITGMNEVMNKLQNIITVEVFTQVTDKLQEQIDGIKGNMDPMGGGNRDININ